MELGLRGKAMVITAGRKGIGLACARGRKGLRINAVNPGATMTGRVQEALRVVL